MDLFPGFTHGRFQAGGAEIHYVRAGAGAPVLLLHGYPQTHACWHRIAPLLAQHYTVVCADLRGYGDSSKPAGLPDHSNYSKRAMAQDMVELMASLGFGRFHLVGHDRGGRVAHRLAADHPRRVHTLAVLDISPTLKMFESTNLAFATAYYHWFLMLQPPPLPEQMLAGRVPFNILGRVGREEPDLSKFDDEAVREYVRCFADPAAIHASCEDYRAAGTIDLEHDRADRAAGRKLPMPVLALWGSEGVVARLFDCLADWREVAADVSGRALPCGHFVPEEAPAETLAEITAFLRRHPLETP
ncbi:alpha/beta hydrolase [Arenimonas sp.]|uniref:alpha/beta fold hydrolase n=1 Tax=Arenimonas sp. TaxID=1872635 RepID=UPI002E32A684|nr:alpha/beta hydrolase [Arenimonas sp.]HEX4853700.1 alpha/beta hydrolase [Arenimonas sp.]